MTLHPALPSRVDWPRLRADYGSAGLLLSLTLPEAARRFRGRAAYLAAPITWSAVFTGIAQDRVPQPGERRDAARWVLECSRHGITAVSPLLLMSAALLEEHRGGVAGLDPVFWANWREPLLREARLLLVPPVEGWDRDRAIWADAREALDHNIHVILLQEGA